MKKLSLFAVVLSIAACSQMKNENSVVNVIDVRETGIPELDASKMKNRDAAVYYSNYSIFNDSVGSYELTYFHNYTGEMQVYRGLIGSEMIYDQAKYEWQNDTSIRFTLMNSATEEEYVVNLFGNGKRSGMTFDEDSEMEFSENN